MASMAAQHHIAPIMEPPRPGSIRMIEAAGTTQQIRRAYDLWSYIYGRVAGPLERGPRRRALELATIVPGDRVLEVAVGTGAILSEILKRGGKQSIVCGIDLSLKMLRRTNRLVRRACWGEVGLYQADTRCLPFRDETFDLVYSSYLLDLLGLKDLPQVLGEFKRVLQPGGQIVLVNLSREDSEKLTLLERFYRWLPPDWVPYLLGSCRPVFMEPLVKAQGFVEIGREFISQPTRSEIVTARKPIG
jgi:demethylmenaquinone methyltransferase / 2-methoxy-6-polyprenyl-1,4-benzoquinol methylase